MHGRKGSRFLLGMAVHMLSSSFLSPGVLFCSAAGPAPEDRHEVQCDSSGHKNGPILGRLHVSTVRDVAQALSSDLGLCKLLNCQSDGAAAPCCVDLWQPGFTALIRLLS